MAYSYRTATMKPAAKFSGSFKGGTAKESAASYPTAKFSGSFKGGVASQSTPTETEAAPPSPDEKKSSGALQLLGNISVEPKISVRTDTPEGRIAQQTAGTGYVSYDVRAAQERARASIELQRKIREEEAKTAGYKRRAEQLEAADKRFFESAGMQRIGAVANQITQPASWFTGKYAPIEERKGVGKVAYEVVQGGLAGPIQIGGAAVSAEGKLILLGEAMTNQNLRPGILGELKRSGKEAFKVYEKPSTWASALIFASPEAAKRSYAKSVESGKGVQVTVGSGEKETVRETDSGRFLESGKQEVMAVVGKRKYAGVVGQEVHGVALGGKEVPNIGRVSEVYDVTQQTILKPVSQKWGFTVDESGNIPILQKQAKAGKETVAAFKGEGFGVGDKILTIGEEVTKVPGQKPAVKVVGFEARSQVNPLTEDFFSTEQLGISFELAKGKGKSIISKEGTARPADVKAAPVKKPLIMQDFSGTYTRGENVIRIPWLVYEKGPTIFHSKLKINFPKNKATALSHERVHALDMEVLEKSFPQEYGLLKKRLFSSISEGEKEAYTQNLIKRGYEIPDLDITPQEKKAIYSYIFEKEYIAYTSEKYMKGEGLTNAQNDFYSQAFDLANKQKPVTNILSQKNLEVVPQSVSVNKAAPIFEISAEGKEFARVKTAGFQVGVKDAEAGYKMFTDDLVNSRGFSENIGRARASITSGNIVQVLKSPLFVERVGGLQSVKSAVVAAEKGRVSGVGVVPGFSGVIITSGKTSGIARTMRTEPMKPFTIDKISPVFELPKPATGTEGRPEVVGKNVPSTIGRSAPRNISRSVPYVQPKTSPGEIFRTQPREEPREISREVPREITRQQPREIQRSVQRQQTRQITKTIRPTETTTKTPPIVFGFGGAGGRRGEGYNVFVRQRGVFRQKTFRPLSKEEALSYGADIVKRTAAATFKIKPAGQRATGRYRGTSIPLSAFKRKEGMYIQPSRKSSFFRGARISSRGEVFDISLKGGKKKNFNRWMK
jgi:hypothetical protein